MCITFDDIFDEFNYGVLSVNSIRDFLNFARTTWQTPPQYLLLIGDATYDPRNYEGEGYLDFVPTKLVDTIYSETASDDALVDFNNDGLGEMAIGRIPAQNAAMVTIALNKTISFEQANSSQNLSRGIVFAYDNPIGYDFLVMSMGFRDQLPPGTPNVFVRRSNTNPNAALITQLNTGPMLVNFSGHGTTGTWASPANFRSSNVALLNNADRLSVYTMLTCLNGYFHGVGFDSLSEVLFNSPNRGAAATWASTGETTAFIQQDMGLRFYHQVGVGQITRLGDLIVDAKTVVPGGRDVRLSWVLLGDPLLKMR